MQEKNCNPHYSVMRCEPPTPILEPITDSEKSERIIYTVSRITEILFSKMESKTRKREVVESRYLCYYFIKKHTKITLKLIGQKFGNRDHSSVIHGLQTIQDLIETNNKIVEQINQIESKLILWKNGKKNN